MRRLLFMALFFFFCSGENNNERPLDFHREIGFNVHLPDDRTLDYLDSLNVSWVRMCISWRLIEPEKGVYYWDFPDDRIRTTYERGFNILLTVWETPAWAASDGAGNSVPACMDEWEEFMETVVNRYSREIQYWGIWNEPNGGGGEYFKGTPEEFRDSIYLPGILAMKRVHPEAKAVGPGITVHTGWEDWFSKIMNDSALSLTDVVSLHAYVRGDADDLFWIIDKREYGEGDIIPIENILDEHGIKEKEFWLEETGWPTGGSHGVGDSLQGVYYEAFLKRPLENDFIDKVFFYEIIDDPDAVGEEIHFGILRKDYSPKPAFHVVWKFTN